MARYGIKTDDAFGVSVYELRRMAKPLRRDHELALALWETGNHEARLLASMVDDPAVVTARADGGVGRGLRLVGRLRPGHLQPVRQDAASPTTRCGSGAARRTSGSSAPPSPRWRRWPCRTRRPRDDAFLEILELVPARGRGRPQLRQEGRQLGAAQHRQAEPAAARGGDRDGRGHPRLGRGPRRRRPQDPAARSVRWVARDALRELRSEKLLARLGARA